MRADDPVDTLTLIEINEAFASVVLPRAKDTGADMAKVNVTVIERL